MAVDQADAFDGQRDGPARRPSNDVGNQPRVIRQVFARVTPVDVRGHVRHARPAVLGQHEAGNIARRLPHPRCLGRIGGKRRHERQRNQRFRVNLQRRQRTAKRQQIRFLEAAQHVVARARNRRLVAASRAVDLRAQFRQESKVGMPARTRRKRTDGVGPAAASARGTRRGVAGPIQPNRSASAKSASGLPTRCRGQSRQSRTGIRPAERTLESRRPAPPTAPRRSGGSAHSGRPRRVRCRRRGSAGTESGRGRARA